MVTSIPIPRFRDVKQTPLKFSNCTTDFNQKGARVDGHPQQYAHEWCAKVPKSCLKLGAVIMSAIPGLITLAVEGLSSWIKGKQNHWIDDAVTIMRRSNFEIRNELKQYKDDLLVYGKHSAESLNDVIKTVNTLHQKNTRLERLVMDCKFGKVSDVVATVNYNFELQLFMEQAQEEHVAQFRQMKQVGKTV